MSLFMEALSKQIICHMNHNNKEIISLKTKLSELESQLSKGCVVCCHMIIGGSNDVQYSFDCNMCGLLTCDECIDKTWTFATYTDNEMLPVQVLDADEILFSDITDEMMYCSHDCFKKCYGELPVVNKYYREKTKYL